MTSMRKGWRAVALSALVAACGDGGTEAAVATGVSATSPVSQSALTGTAVAQAPAVRVVDQRGDPMPNVTVSFAAGGGGTVASASAVTDASGAASAGTWTLGGTAGTQTVTATVGTLPPVQFTATAQARIATTLTATSATTQAGVSLEPVAEPPTVRVDDQAGQPLAGVVVTFAVTAGTGRVGGTSAITGFDGIATAGTWSLGQQVGHNAVTATVPGLPPVTFTATGAIHPCLVSQAYVAGTTIDGSLATTDCRLTSGHYRDLYQVGGPVSLTLTSSTMDAWLTVPDGDVLVPAETDAVPGSTSATLRVFATWPYVQVSSEAVRGTGAYQLSSTPLAGNEGCGVYWVVGDVTVAGTLAATDCAPGAARWDEYRVMVHPDQTLSVRLQSTAFDAQLELRNQAGTRVAVNDDSGGTSNSLINYANRTTAPVPLVVRAGTAVAGQTGAYTLIVDRN